MRWIWPALLGAIVLVLAGYYYLWEWRADQISGDVLIHLVFARNFAGGHWFEFALGQVSRANTSFVYEWILALIGLATGQIQSNEGLLAVTRLYALLCMGFTGWRIFVWSCRMDLPPRVAALLAVFLVLNPVTFYWTAVNPMETCMALVFTILTAEWMWRMSRSTGETNVSLWRWGLTGGLLAFGVSLFRPEWLALGPILALALFLGQGKRTLPAGVWLVAVPLVLTALQALALALAGIPVVPTAAVARHLVALTFDSVRLPLLGIPYSPDPWKILLAMGPLVAAALAMAFRGRTSSRPVYFAALGGMAFSVLFFSFYSFTTWQGRYMLPAIFLLVPPAVATIAPRIPRMWGWILGPSYALALCAITLWPLARYAQAPAERARAVHFVHPPNDAKTILVQEVQSAYFHPHLYHISTEGLITMEAYHAYRKGETLYDFIREMRPDLVGTGRYYLKDPDGLQNRINRAAREKSDLSFRGIQLKFLGEMAGCGPVFQAAYQN